MFAVIHIPDFALQSALRHEPELHSKPVALLGEAPDSVLQMTEPARAAGVTPGLSSTQALARCPRVLIKSRSPSQETAAAAALLHCAHAFSPRIESTGPGICTLELKGLPIESELRNGSPDELSARQSPVQIWAEKLLRQLEAIHLRGQIGLAETPDIARHAARQARPFLFITDRDEFLSGLSLESLNPAPELLRVLRQWGIRTLGAFMRLGKDQIGERLGPEALDLFELAAGRNVRPLKLAAPPETFEETIDFPQPIESLEPLLFILRRFVDQISQRLAPAGLAAEEMTLRLAFASGDFYERTIGVPAPTGEPDTLFRMLHTHLENVRTAAPLTGLHLSAKPCRSRSHQFDLFESSLRDPNQFHETAARLSALLSPKRVGTPLVEPSHRPDTFQMQPPQFDSAPIARQNSPIKSPLGPALRRFRPPLHAEVDTEKGCPVFIRTLKFTSPIARSRGPWHASGDWWDTQNLWRRDEWDIQTPDGSLYRVCREEGDWFLEGIYD